MRIFLQIWIVIIASFILGSSLGSYLGRHRVGSKFVVLKRNMMYAYQEGRMTGQSLIFVCSFLENSDNFKEIKK